LLLGFLVMAHYLLPRILREVSRHKSDELLVLAALVIVLLCGTVTYRIGLSMELGAFLAGMMLGESRFRHQLEADVRPFRDLLLGLFFITIGMLIDLQLLVDYWFRILVSGLVFLVFKAAIIAGVARLLGETWRAALPAGMAISQGGEFLFALMALATRSNLVPGDVAAFLISVTIVSMMMTPVLIRHGPRLVDALVLRRESPTVVPNDLQDLPPLDQQNHVVILGFGRVGQSVARFLKPLGIEYVVVESDTVRVTECAIAGEPIFFGNTARRDILKAAGVEKAKLVIISFDNLADTRKILEVIREINPDIPVLTRTRDDTHLEQLMALGATEVIPETHEASLTLASHALLMLDIPAQKVDELISSARRNRYRMLQGFYHGAKMNLTLRKDRHGNALHAVVLTGAAWACHKRVAALKLPEKLRIWELHRQHQVFRDHELVDIVLRNGDVAVLKGALDAMPLGEAYLLRG
jgi:CPA2 family monovalent cation:H+ antiporter-2